MSKKKILVVVVVIVVIAAVVAVVIRSRQESDAIAVETAPADKQEIVQTVTATGRIQPKTQINISADVSAKITKLEIEEGEWVEQGQFLAELDRERYLAAVESAEASLRSSQANARLAEENKIKAQKDFERVAELFDQSLESESSRDSSHAAHEVEKARHESALDGVEQARAVLKQAKDDLAKTSIYAPMSGTISMLNKEVGEIALGSQFQEDVIMVISNLSGMEALVDVDENDVVQVALEDTSSIEVDALPERAFEGVVTEIANSAKVSSAGTTDQKTEFEVKISLNDPGSELRPGMTASADIVTEVRSDALVVPIQSVAVRTVDQLMGDGSDGGADEADGEPSETTEPQFEPDKDGFVEVVFVVENDLAVARQVKTGIQSDSHIEIVEGLTEGEVIVTGNYRAISKDLKHGTEVQTDGEEGGEP